MHDSSAPPLRTNLVTNDDRAILHLTRYNLERRLRGVRVIVASSSPEAWDAFERVHPDLVITNLMKAGFSGYELIRRIREHDSATKILVTTKADSRSSYDEALAAGADTVMGSPFGRRELFDAVFALLPELQPPEDHPAPPGG